MTFLRVHQSMIVSPIKTDYKELRNILIVALLVTTLVTVLFSYRTSFYTILDHTLYDFYLKSAGRSKTTDSVVVADIDDLSLTAVGQWPWARYRLATLLQSITQTRQLSLVLISFSQNQTEPLWIRSGELSAGSLGWIWVLQECHLD